MSDATVLFLPDGEASLTPTTTLVFVRQYGVRASITLVREDGATVRFAPFCVADEKGFTLDMTEVAPRVDDRCYRSLRTVGNATRLLVARNMNALAEMLADEELQSQLSRAVEAVEAADLQRQIVGLETRIESLTEARDELVARAERLCRPVA